MFVPSIARRILLAVGLSLSALPAVAGEFTGVVELFTSQGCSSCPPADAALKKLIDDGKVVALSYHVDYWNYLGWADTLATKDNTARQYAYARMLKRSGVYTPQAILNGRSHINGADYGGINRKLVEMGTNGKGLAVPVEASVKNDEIEINVGAGTGKANLIVVYFSREQMVDVKTGENSGKRISYWHSVRDIQTVGRWDGKPAKFVLPASVLQDRQNGGCAVLLQKMKDNETPGAILGATTVLADNAAN